MREIVEDPPWEWVARSPLTALIETQHGVVAFAQARRFLSEKAIRHRVAAGRWRRVHRGVYFTYGGPLTLQQRQWIAVLGAGGGGGAAGAGGAGGAGYAGAACLGGISALQVHGLRGISAATIHLVVAEARQIRPPAGVTVHRLRLADEDHHPYSRPPTTTIGRAVVDAAAWARSDDEARLVIAASFQQRLVTAEEVGQVLDRLPNTHRRFLVVTTAREAAGGSHSLGELALAGLCRGAGLPLPTRQLRFRDLDGRMRFLDAVFDPWRVAVEVDGAQHSEVAHSWDDGERDNAAVLAGYRILRFPQHVVRGQPRKVAAQLRAALELAGWRPEPG